MRRSSAFLSAVAVAVLALAPSVADARAGGGGSFGSRGGRTFTAPPTTSTAPFAASPMDRTMTPRPNAAPSPGYAGGPYGAPARSGFGSGLLGGLLGVGLGSMLFGGGFFGNGGGFGFIGLILQMALLFFIGRWVLRRVLGGQVAFAGMPRMGQPAAGGGMPGGGARPAPSVNVGPADYAAFDQCLQAVQASWTARDVRTLGQLATPEMASYFAEQLAEQTSRGVQNSVTNVQLDKGDLSEAWAENGREYATVAMRFSAVDVTRDSLERVVDGDPNTRTVATELWTFVRAPGGRWLLSAIQQAR